MFSRPQRIEPQPGQESVWDYPRPPRLDPCEYLIEVIFNGITIARTNRSIRVLETSHPPTYYIPPEDVDSQYLELNPHRSFCEWKGQAQYHNVIVTNEQEKPVGRIKPCGAIQTRPIVSCLFKITAAFTPSRWMLVLSMASRYSLSLVISMVAGSPPRSSGPLRAG
jgi:uncharacterized protein (DUF427 family)